MAAIPGVPIAGHGDLCKSVLVMTGALEHKN